MEGTCIDCGIEGVYCKGMCKKCYGVNYRSLNKDKIKHDLHRYYMDNREKCLLYVKKWCEDNPDKCIINQKKHHEKTGGRAMSENRECAAFLGVYVAERVLKNVFKNVEQMPNGNPGFDFLCGQGYKIDVKCSCLWYRNIGTPRWGFKIRKNKIADYFLC